MQERMREHQLSEAQTAALLRAAEVGHLGTVGAGGFPYVTPVHFVLLEGRIYIHGLAKGTRLQNLRENPRVCFETAGPHSYLQAETPCDTNTAYQSVIVLGTATVVEAREKKIRALEALVAKYTPQHVGKTFPENMLKMTAVVEITFLEVTGKYYA
ncbi:pyridoxamine 5'-phosphate oxidase family protein [Desulfovibrio legallii]|uniref:Pyridoxamine 5'-phosphate oxidase family protein n=1 Tax=Desulfovibrio legallii TaxID=571438 RepID=A0A1G7I5J3_9BACT|nr:pyridoxamine 5'-phosphate oxidase family protein [Desulfovibrio legallii]SDF07990.1 hypothetical protein SAMN05192586_101162 [Desulfovibrio legallii]